MSSYLWVLSLEFANMGAHTQFTFLKYPCLGPTSTPSGKISSFIHWHMLACNQSSIGCINCYNKEAECCLVPWHSAKKNRAIRISHVFFLLASIIGTHLEPKGKHKA
jgi:hypothetical protein